MAKPKTKRVKDVERDAPDLRDRLYEPALLPLKDEIPPPSNLHILDQGEEGACTGFGLAAVIHRLYQLGGATIRPLPKGKAFQPSASAGQRDEISPFMLYEMAKRHDEWRGHKYEGSSNRGALRGWFHNGVCRRGLWPTIWKEGKGDLLTLDQAKDARHCTLGAYYRLRPVISDFHAALNEVPAIFVSADTHAGWDRPAGGVIKFEPENDGGHAFAIVGYNKDGFWIQNSWGPGWGRHGVALWTYEDWNKNLMDAWVVQLARPTPTIFHQRNTAAEKGVGRGQVKAAAPNRAEILGHFLNVDDGKFVDTGRYWTSENSIRDTADLVAGGKDGKTYDHLAVYAHGGLNSADAAARRILATKDGFLRNGVYPFHVMYNTGLLEEVGDVVHQKWLGAETRVGAVSDWTDVLIESLVRRPVTPIWDEMKRGAQLAFEKTGAGTKTMALFAERLAKSKKKIHLAGHSTGAILLGHLLDALEAGFGDEVEIASCSLFAPACTLDFFDAKYRPRLGGIVRKMTVYNLTDRQEQDDNVAKAYRKSLLYLVSNALEREKQKPLLGMQTFADAKTFKKPTGLTLVYSEGKAASKSSRSASTSHGGFDNDPCTMNDLLKTMLGRAPAEGFTAKELDY